MDAEYRKRPPLTHLDKAASVSIDINAGITDGHKGSVPISHSLRAFNVLADPGDRLSDQEIEQVAGSATEVPPSLADQAPDDPQDVVPFLPGGRVALSYARGLLDGRLGRSGAAPS